MKVAWASDIHLDHADEARRQAFYAAVRAVMPNALWISGDISNGQCIEAHLRELLDEVPCRVMFVLGNHDFWGRWIKEVRFQVGTLAGTSGRLVYLTTDTKPVLLSNDAALIGHDGWADGRCGDYASSTVVLRDYIAIRDFIPLDKWTRYRRLGELGDEAATRLREKLAVACAQCTQVFIVTHAPPWREACLYGGAPTSREYLPHFACRATGDAIIEAAERWPDRSLTVLCGHTHENARAQIRPNLTVRTAAAEYEDPRITEVFEVP